MKNLNLFILIISILLLQTVKAEIVVVVNKKNTIHSLSKSEVIDLYMGRHTQFSNGTSVKPIDQAKNSSQQQQFYKLLIGKSLAKVNAYWARLTFTGRAKPPKNIDKTTHIKEFVKSNPGAIAYLDSKSIDSNLKIVYRFEPF